MAELTIEAVEEQLWIQSAWRIEQTDVDRILAMVNGYAAGASGPVPVRGYTEAQLMERTEEAYARGLEVGHTRGLAEAQRDAAEHRVPDVVFESPDGTVWIFHERSTRGATPRIPAQRQPAESMPDTRTCRCCSETKELAAGFSRDKRSPGGYKTQCKGCETKAARVRRLNKQR